MSLILSARHLTRQVIGSAFLIKSQDHQDSRPSRSRIKTSSRPESLARFSVQAAYYYHLTSLPALTGRTRQLERCSNSRAQPVVGQALSDRSTCRRVGQACPISSWTGAQDQPGRSDNLSDQLGLASVGQCPSDHRRTRLFEHRSNCRVRPVNAGSASISVFNLNQNFFNVCEGSLAKNHNYISAKLGKMYKLIQSNSHLQNKRGWPGTDTIFQLARFDHKLAIHPNTFGLSKELLINTPVKTLYIHETWAVLRGLKNNLIKLIEHKYDELPPRTQVKRKPFASTTLPPAIEITEDSNPAIEITEDGNPTNQEDTGDEEEEEAYKEDTDDEDKEEDEEDDDDEWE
ncbi:hypothetical protein PCANC_01553 [Puccinia coronata f. sp. avenae]|uniref:Uncharacterized protein n=1 Tax=Puccinia coronata f. sp. avenae TaxID=200324 RepID=A0A2N5W0J6_9BASI|nr:hypothetical protein PCANC_01553 [Puccinia coronata f. sp. avenae]